jgi:uncharacterized membrane protein
VDAGWLVVRWLHVLAMALFVGGQLVLAVAIVPVLRGSQRDALRAIARRFGWASVAALGVLIATGTALASHGHWWDASTLHVKLALVAAVAVLIVWHMRRPGDRLLRTGQSSSTTRSRRSTKSGASTSLGCPTSR